MIGSFSASVVQNGLSMSPRIQRLAQRSKELALSGRRTLYAPDAESLVYHWSDACVGPAPISGEYAIPLDLPAVTVNDPFRHLN
jgi:hypothetical protein